METETVMGTVIETEMRIVLGMRTVIVNVLVTDSGTVMETGTEQLRNGKETGKKRKKMVTERERNGNRTATDREQYGNECVQIWHSC